MAAPALDDMEAVEDVALGVDDDPRWPRSSFGRPRSAGLDDHDYRPYGSVTWAPTGTMLCSGDIAPRGTSGYNAVYFLGH